MKRTPTVRGLLLSILLVTGFVAAPAFGQITVNIRIAPPALLYETTPAMAPGYVWAPGYWAWHDDQYIWIHGRSITQRVGYRWEPDRWEQRDQAYYRHPGQWERDAGYKMPKQKKEKKAKKEKPEHGNGKPGKGGRSER